MPYTNCKVHMEFIDASAIADSTASTEHGAAITNMNLLKSQQEYPMYAMLDLNKFVLDGSMPIMTEGIEVAFLSEQASDEDCSFIDNPNVTIDFTTKHTSAGITLFFVGDYPEEIKVYWYDLSGQVLIAQSFYPSGLKSFCKKQVDNYGKLKIEFIKTRLPGQRIHCRYIKYGTEIDWQGESVKTASLTEEMDVTSASIPINTAEISIVDLENDFELSNQDGVWKSVQKKQEISIVEELVNQEVPCGTLYIDTWRSQGNIVTFSLIDRIGIMDKTIFYDGRMYNNEAAGVIIAEVMHSAGVEDYTVTDDAAAVLLSGYIPICSHREALQQIMFACGAVADCSRTGGINIFMPSRYANSVIGTDRKFRGTTIEIDKYVSGISISYKRYTLKDEEVEIFNDILPEGVSVIEFSEPYSNVSATAGEILAASTNYIKINMAEQGNCIVYGQKYESKDIVYTENVDMLDAGEEKNIISYSGCTLFDNERVKEVAKKLLKHYQLRQIVKMRYLLESEKAGDWVNVMDTSKNMVTSGITSQTIDLTGGFIAEATCRGYSKSTTNYVYAGEICAGERGMF